MKTNSKKSDNLVQVPESALVSLVVAQLKGKILFSEKIEAAKKYLKHINKKATV